MSHVLSFFSCKGPLMKIVSRGWVLYRKNLTWVRTSEIWVIVWLCISWRWQRLEYPALGKHFWTASLQASYLQELPEHLFALQWCTLDLVLTIIQEIPWSQGLLQLSWLHQEFGFCGDLTDEDLAEARLWFLMGRGTGEAKSNQLPSKLVRKNKKSKGHAFELKIHITSGS